MRIAGIDPGLGGAVVVLDNGVPIEWMRMPTYTVGKNNRVNAAELANFFRPLQIDVAVIEQVGAMPGQGVTSMFTFGHATGTVMGVIGALRIVTAVVTPQQWKKAAGIIGQGKDASRGAAVHLWPFWEVLGKKGEGQALADAALLAQFWHNR